MSFDSISSSSILVGSNAVYLGKENKLVKGGESDELKQTKLDVTEGKSEGCKEEASGGGEMNVDQAIRALEVANDPGLSWNSPNSHTGGVVGSNCSGTDFSGSSTVKDISEVEDDGSLDDWEALADAWAEADDKKVGNEDVTQLDHVSEVVKQLAAAVGSWKPRPENSSAWRHSDAFHSEPKPENGQAWRPSDAFCSNPKPADGQTWRGRYAFHLKPQPEDVQSCRRGDAFQWKLKPDKHDQKYESLLENKKFTQLDHLPEVVYQPTAPVDVWKPKPENGQAWRCGNASGWKPKPEKGQARRGGDAFSAKTLPNLPKKQNYPMKANSLDCHGGTTLGCKNIASPPSSCPICYEDLDSTDLSFLPCSCGFQLCLFCHKRILEDDGRCPGCRKLYEDNAAEWKENPDLNGACATPWLVA